MSTHLKKLEVALVLPVFSVNTSFLSVIHRNCMELANAMPEVKWTIIIINDGSKQFLSENYLFQQLPASINYHYYHYENNKGKGYAVRFGLNKAANADIFIYTDYDFPFGIKAVVNTVNILKHKKADIVAADRGNHYLTLLPVSRRIITMLIRVVNSNILKLHFNDTQAGLKGMNNRGLSVMLHTSVNGFLFDLQFVKNSERQKLRIHALPVNCKQHIQLKNFSLSFIYKEMKNLFFLLLKRKSKDILTPYPDGFRGVRYSSRMFTGTVLEKTDRNPDNAAGSYTADITELKN